VQNRANIREARSATRSRNRAKASSWHRLVLTIAGTVLGTVVPGLVGVGPVATLIGAILVGTISAFVTGGEAPTRGKAVIALLLCLCAVILTITGFTLVDFVRGQSLFGNRQYTFPIPPNDVVTKPTPSPGPPTPNPTPPPTLNPPPTPNLPPTPAPDPRLARSPAPAPPPEPPAPAPTSNPPLKPHPEQPSPTSASSSEPASPVPNSPTQVSPANGTRFSHYPRTTTLKWLFASGAVKYFLEIECWQCAGTPQWSFLDNVTTAETSYTFDFVGMQRGRWRVAAIAADGTQGASSGWWEFKYTV
jgi:hypothetical protein